MGRGEANGLPFSFCTERGKAQEGGASPLQRRSEQRVVSLV